MTAPPNKTEITEERVLWFAKYERANPTWGVFHCQLDDGNYEHPVGTRELEGEPADVVEAAAWFNTLSPTQRRRLSHRASELLQREPWRVYGDDF